MANDERVIILSGDYKVGEKKTLNVTENGQYNVLPSQGRSISEVDVNVNVPSQGPIDTEMSSTSTNAVQNKVIKNYVDRKDYIKKGVMVGSQGQIENYYTIELDYTGNPIYKLIDNAGASPTMTRKKIMTESDMQSLSNSDIDEILNS